jgi:cell wall-associated NlpC family hydrolase
MRIHPLHVPLLAAALLALTTPPLVARETPALPAHGVIGVDEAQLTPEFWIRRAPHPDRVLLDRTAIAAQNAALERQDASLHDLRALPATLERAQVAGWIGARSARPQGALYDVDGAPVPAATLDRLVDELALATIPERQATRYGLVVRRAALRTFPTTLRVFSTRGDTDIDRFQESAEFPGTPVVIAHASRDGAWLFVVSPRYAAWMEKDAVAEGPAAQVFGYVDKAPYRVITAANARTVYTREQPALSQLGLDMGVRVPLASGWPADKPVNGQHPYTAHVIELPLRAADGTLRFAPALLQKNVDSVADYLPLTPANLIHQAFRFLGERYGWGHAYDARDCSGFVAEVYRSMGVLLPRNTRDQSVSPALDKRTFGPADDPATRRVAARALEVGDLVYIPGHVMLVIGRIDGEPYVIHDTTGIRYRGPDGALRRVELNAVAVSPLLPLLFDDEDTYVERMTSIVHVRTRPGAAR